jgi:hypothetical protein
MQIISSMDTSLPTEHRDGSPVRGRPPGPTSAGTAAWSLLVKQKQQDEADHVRIDRLLKEDDMPKRYSRRSGVGDDGMVSEVSAYDLPKDFGLASDLKAEEQHQHPLRPSESDFKDGRSRQMTEPYNAGKLAERFGMAAEVAGTAGFEMVPLASSSAAALRPESAALLLELRSVGLNPVSRTGHHLLLLLLNGY